MITKPMLAANTILVPEEISYPKMASPKLDGIRCLLHPEHGPVSRSFKPLPNRHIQNTLASLGMAGLDGEIVTWNEDGSIKPFNDIQSDVMSRDGTPDFSLLVFDDFTNPTDSFFRRLQCARARVGEEHALLRNVPHTLIHNMYDLRDLDAEFVAQGYEGTMVRCPYARYKSGRSTLKQGWLLKLKGFVDAEGIVIGFEEQLENTNEKTRDELGHAKRSSAKQGMVGKGTAGKVILATDQWGEVRAGTMSLGAGMCKLIWDNQSSYIGKIGTFKYQPHGMKDKPRVPVFKGFRDPADLS